MAEEPEHAGAEIDEEGRNPTQRRMDEEGVEDVPVDANWVADDDASLEAGGDERPAAPGGWETESRPHEGEAGQDL